MADYSDWCEECCSEKATVTWINPQTQSDERLCYGCYTDLK